MPNLRKKPYINVTWLRSYLIGDFNCRWSLWHRIHYEFDKKPDTFDFTQYRINHTALLNKTQKRFIAEGYEVIPEVKINVSGSSAVLQGSIDLIAVKDDKCLVIETKTGTPKERDKVQTMLYLWALPKAIRRFEGVPLDGLIVYESHDLEISASVIDKPFVDKFKEFMEDILRGEPDRKFPQMYECGDCKIANCDERFTQDSDEKSDYVAEFF